MIGRKKGGNGKIKGKNIWGTHLQQKKRQGECAPPFLNESFEHNHDSSLTKAALGRSAQDA